MRILFTILPVTSHLLPLAPVAWALQSAGHEVRVVTHTHPTMPGVISGAGLNAVSLGERIDLAAAVRATFENETLQGIAEALAIDPEDSNLWQMVRHYVVSTFGMYFQPDGGHPMVDELIEFTESWQPDLVIWDPLFFPAPIAARACGAVHARLLWGLDRFGWIRSEFRKWLAEDASRPDLMAAAMKPTLDRLGQEFDEELLVGKWTIDPTPPEMRLPTDLTYVPVRPVPYNGAVEVPAWLLERPSKPRVCLTLGTSGRELFAENEISVDEVLRSMAELDIEVVATLNATQLAAVETVPATVRTIDYLPLNLLLPTCSAIVHLGGTGTLAAAVAQEVPQLLIPKDGSEYVDFANFVASRGAGVVIEQRNLTTDLVKEQLVRLLGEQSFKDGAATLRKEMMATPSPTEIVPVLEKLTVQHGR
ncbi:L-rhodinosyltransferase/glycosyltransferase [Amycolatopsis xylanica]|uniref:L-rhodinosyltransferase/glycosyltransferase n=1 Tax=Amycolatopsis xylanica TaxID=589385 RepID=A0A1H3RCA7_9PSEU|nr:activator-dependent family glycosyltransferase [Amycolatopsis xylanica]SDZ23297.1 L-rhodinosyltransferase/glycosyltransferase [Amycolatopsis xylanica]